MLRDQPLDLGIHDRGTLLPNFVWDRCAGDFERFVWRMASIACEARLVPVGPNLPIVVVGEKSGFHSPPRSGRPVRGAARPKRHSREIGRGEAGIDLSGVGGEGFDDAAKGGASGLGGGEGGLSAVGSQGGGNGSGDRLGGGC